VDLEAIGDVIDSPEDADRAQEIADRAVTLVRNTGDAVPLAAPEHACFVVLPESRYSAEGHILTQEIRKRARAAPILQADSSMTRDTLDEAMAKLQTCEGYVVAAFSSVNSGSGSVGLSGELPHVIESLIATAKPVTLVALGNPYLLRNFPNVAAYMATFSTVPPSEIAAVKALWGEIGISGHLPVTIPDLAKYGEGIVVAAKAK
jgi:beta-N-acetylhexosaminidase